MSESYHEQEEEIRRAVCSIIYNFRWLILYQNTSESSSSGQPNGRYFPEIELGEAVEQADMLVDYYKENEGLPGSGNPHNPASAIVSVTAFILGRQLALGKIIYHNSASQGSASKYEERLRKRLYNDLVNSSGVDDFTHEYLISKSEPIAAANLKSLNPTRNDSPPIEVEREARQFVQEYYGRP